MALLCDSLSEALDYGSGIFYKFNLDDMKGKSTIWDLYTNFTLLKDCIETVKPTEKLHGEVDIDVTRILITHQIQLLSTLMQYYKSKRFTANDLFPDEPPDEPDHNNNGRDSLGERIRRIKENYNEALWNGTPPKMLPKPTDGAEVLEMLKIIFLHADRSVKDHYTTIERQASPSPRTISRQRSRSNRSRERRGSNSRRVRPYERRNSNPRQSHSNRSRGRQGLDSRQSRPNPHIGTQDPFSGRVLHVRYYERRDSTPERSRPNPSRERRGSNPRRSYLNHPHEEQDSIAEQNRLRNPLRFRT